MNNQKSTNMFLTEAEKFLPKLGNTISEPLLNHKNPISILHFYTIINTEIIPHLITQIKQQMDKNDWIGVYLPVRNNLNITISFSDNFKLWINLDCTVTDISS